MTSKSENLLATKTFRIKYIGSAFDNNEVTADNLWLLTESLKELQELYQAITRELYGPELKVELRISEFRFGSLDFLIKETLEWLGDSEVQHQLSSVAAIAGITKSIILPMLKIIKSKSELKHAVAPSDLTSNASVDQSPEALLRNPKVLWPLKKFIDIAFNRQITEIVLAADDEKISISQAEVYRIGIENLNEFEKEEMLEILSVIDDRWIEVSDGNNRYRIKAGRKLLADIEPGTTIRALVHATQWMFEGVLSTEYQVVKVLEVVYRLDEPDFDELLG